MTYQGPRGNEPFWDRRAREGQASWRSHYSIPRTEFALNLLGEAVAGGAKPAAIGLGGWIIVNGVSYGIGSVLYTVDSMIPKIGKPLSAIDDAVAPLPKAVKVPDSVPLIGGKDLVDLDRMLSKPFESIFGRTPEKQQQYRERQGIPAPSYLPEQKPQGQTQQPAQQPVLGPADYAPDFGGAANLFLSVALLYAAVTTLPRMIRRGSDMRMNAAQINSNLELAASNRERVASEQETARYIRELLELRRKQTGGGTNDESTGV